MGIQLRAADTELWEMLNFYGDPAVDAGVCAERALLAELHGGCSVPVGAYAMPFAAGLKLTAQVTSLDGTQGVSASATSAHVQLLGKRWPARCWSRARRRSCDRSGQRSNPGSGRSRRRHR